MKLATDSLKQEKVKMKDGNPTVPIIDKKSPEPLYEQVKRYIIDGINSGLFKPNQRIYSESEFSSRFGISRLTVRKALDDLLHQGMLFKIQGKGTFVEDPRKLKNVSSIQGKPTIGMIALTLENPLVSQMIAGIEQVLYKRGFQLIFSHSNRDQAIEEEKIETLRNNGVEGIILYPSDREADDRTLRKAIEDRFPLVLIDRYLEEYEISSVTSDNFTGGYKITEHFIEHGYKNIGFFAPPHAGVTSILERFKGYCQALKDNGMPLKDSLVENQVNISVPKDSLGDWRQHKERMRHYLKSNKDVEAVFVDNDYFAMAFYNVCHELGMRIPEDIAIAGFDDDVGVSNLIPPLTTVRQDGLEIGRKAAEMLLEMIKHGDWKERHIVIPIELKIRKSCGC